MTLLDVGTSPCRIWLQLYRHVAVNPIDNNDLDQNNVVLVSRCNLAAAVHHLQAKSHLKPSKMGVFTGRVGSAMIGLSSRSFE
jgi:hypothetical protein